MANAGELRKMIAEYNCTHMYEAKEIIVGALRFIELKLDADVEYRKNAQDKAEPLFDGIPIEIDYQNRTEIRLK